MADSPQKPNRNPAKKKKQAAAVEATSREATSREASSREATSREASSKGFDRRTALKTALAITALAGSQAASGALPVVQDRSGRVAKRNTRRGSLDTSLKQRAADDYRNSLSRYGGQLSSPIRDLFLTATKPDEIHFGVVVIGSGYGASITAARLSQYLNPGQRICMLERGKEWIPGSFPDTWASVSGNARSVLFGPGKGKLIKPLGLFNVMMNDEVNILTGNGLGGGSLINASIALRPHSEVFQQSRWPNALNDVQVLGPYYDRVAKSLSLARTPFDQTPKVRARRMAAERLSRNPNFYDRSNVSVMYDHRHLDQQMRNPQGMIQRPCTLCGDCINGCNIGAKNTLAMNYLPVARWNGTEMYTQVTVVSIEKHSGFYRINMEYIDDTQNETTRHAVSINTRLVVVGAGSPGSVSILKQSETPDFKFSPSLGNNWSCNGDTIGFITGLAKGTNIGGHGAYEGFPPVGPTVQSSLNFYRDIELPKRLLIQDAAIPRGVSNLLSYLLRDPSMDQSMVMLGMGHDSAEGKIVRGDGRWKVSWPGLKESQYRQMVFREFEKLAAAHGGSYKRLKAFGDNLVTVHPLGGCGMSDSPHDGTTTHLGQVYDGANGSYQDPVTGGGGVHHGLYVADGSLMSTALGVNPYMTIGALAERIAAHIVRNPNHVDLFG